MAKHLASGSVIKAITATGTPASVGEVTGYNFDGNCNLVDQTVLGDAARVYAAGTKDYNLSIDVMYDPADAAQVDLVEGETVDFEIIPEAGNDIVGTGIVESVSVSGEIDGNVVSTITVKPSGGVTRDAVA